MYHGSELHEISTSNNDRKSDLEKAMLCSGLKDRICGRDEKLGPLSRAHGSCRCCAGGIGNFLEIL